MFIKNIDGDLINSRYITRIYIDTGDETEDYSSTVVVAEMDPTIDDDEILASFGKGSVAFDFKDARNFLRNLEKTLNYGLPMATEVSYENH